MAYDKALVDKAASETGVSADLLERMIAVESSGNPKAVSYKGPQYGEGLMQLSSAVAQDEGVTDRFDPWQNILGGAKDLKAMLDRFGGNEDLALAAYVAGPGKVIQAGGVPASAAPYVKKVTGKMPDAATSTTPPAGGNTSYDPAISRALNTQEAISADYGKAIKGATDSNNVYAQRLDELHGQIEGVQKELSRLDEQTPQAPKETQLPSYDAPKAQNPLGTLMKSMPLLLLAGSRMGRNSSLALMKSMTGVLNGVSEGNDEVRKQYQEDFKAKLDATIQQAQLDHQHYMDILQTLQEHKSDALAKMQVFGALSQNENLQNAARTANFAMLADFANMNGTVLRSLLEAKQAALTSESNAVRMKQEDERLQIERDKAEETKRYHEEQSPLKRAQFAEKLRNDIDKTSVGKAYASLDQYDHVIENVADKIDKGEKIGSMEQGAFLDAYTRIVTGGQAIRGFTLRLNTDHAGLADKANVALQQLGSGGPLSPRQMKEAISVIRDYSKEIEAEYHGEIQRADDFARQAGVIGDDQSVTPFEVDPAKLQGGGAGGWSIKPIGQ